MGQFWGGQSEKMSGSSQRENILTELGIQFFWNSNFGLKTNGWLSRGQSFDRIWNHQIWFEVIKSNH
jgi:hypothetical protein